jgi:hypothetical protein
MSPRPSYRVPTAIQSERKLSIWIHLTSANHHLAALVPQASSHGEVLISPAPRLPRSIRCRSAIKSATDGNPTNGTLRWNATRMLRTYAAPSDRVSQWRLRVNPPSAVNQDSYFPGSIPIALSSSLRWGPLGVWRGACSRGLSRLFPRPPLLGHQISRATRRSQSLPSCSCALHASTCFVG